MAYKHNPGWLIDINYDFVPGFSLFCGLFMCFLVLWPVHSSLAQIQAHKLYEPAEPPLALDSPLLQKRSELWKKVPPGLQGSWADTSYRYSRHDIPSLQSTRTFSVVAWQGERVNAQIVLWSAQSEAQLRVICSPLRHEMGATLPASCMQTYFVRYVLAEGNLTADILDTADRLDLPGQTVRPVWLIINIPSEATSGNYSARIQVRSEGGKSLEFELALEVLPMALPAPADWSFHLDLWQNPWSVARYHHVSPFSSEHLIIMAPHLKYLAQAGQKCITTSIVPQPWGGQTYDPHESLVQWTCLPDGSWSFDYSFFDTYVELCQRCGITGQINCYSMMPWSNQVRFFDQAGGDYQSIKAEPGTTAYEDLWRPFLKDFIGHLQKKDWLDKTAIAMDERPDETIKKLMAFMKETAPSLKIASAINYPADVNLDVYDLSILISNADRFPAVLLSQRKNKKLLTTFYVCCDPKRPNTFTASPPGQAAWLGWFVAARGFDGLLRWAYDSWVEDPLYCTDHVKWTSGDCFLVYPGPRSSIRFEMLREGIEDYEKIRALERVLTEIRPLPAERFRQELRRILDRFDFSTAGRDDQAAQSVRAATLNQFNELVRSVLKERK